MKAAVRPSLMPDIKIANLAVGGGTTVESYYALRSYIKNHGAPSIVVIGYHSFHYVVQDTNVTRTLYFNYLTVPELRDGTAMHNYGSVCCAKHSPHPGTNAHPRGFPRDTDDAVRRKIESYFEQLQSTYPAFIIHSGLTGFDNSLFANMNHLNERGAEQFTNMLSKELHELHLAI